MGRLFTFFRLGRARGEGAVLCLDAAIRRCAACKAF